MTDQTPRPNTDFSDRLLWGPRTAGWHPSKLGETLDLFLEHLGAPPVRTLGELHDRWSEVVGPGLAAHSRPIEVVNGVLTIGCDDASWASQLAWMDGQIKQRCQDVFDGLEIIRIGVRVGS